VSKYLDPTARTAGKGGEHSGEGPATSTRREAFMVTSVLREISRASVRRCTLANVGKYVKAEGNKSCDKSRLVSSSRLAETFSALPAGRRRCYVECAWISSVALNRFPKPRMPLSPSLPPRLLLSSFFSFFFLNSSTRRCERASRAAMFPDSR